MKKSISRLMKVLVCFVGFALALLPFSAVANEAVKATVAYTAKNGMQYAVSSSGLWLNEDGQLKWFQESAFEPTIIVGESNVSHIASNADELIYITETEEGQKINVIMSDGTVMVKDVLLQSESPIVQIEGYYALDELGRISSVYPYEGTLMQLSFEGWANENVSAFSLWESYIIAYKQDSAKLALLSFDTKQAVFPPVNVPSLTWVQVGAVVEDQAVAIALNNTGDLLRINLVDGSYEVLDSNLPSDCAGLRRNEKCVYTLGKYYSELYAIPTRQLLGQMSSKTLTIVNASEGQSDRFRAAVDKFHEKYPDVNVESRYIDDCRVLATEIMGGKDGIDIIGLQDRMMYISAGLLLKSGALLDLNQFEELTALKDEYRDIFGCVTIDGHWYAFPNGYWQYPWRVNETLANQLGWEIPTGRWTWDDFMALAEKVKAWNETAESHMYLLQDENSLLPYFFLEYQANHVNLFAGEAAYQSDDYIQLLKMWKQLNNDGLLYFSPLVMNTDMVRNTLLYCDGTFLPVMEQDKYIYPPTETMESRIPIYVVPAITLNANTPYLEEAVYYLACYMSPEVESKAIYWNIGQQLKDRSLYNTAPSDWGPSVSEENETLWNDMLTQGAPDLCLYDISRQQSNTLLPGLLDGTVSPEQFAAISQQLADMALGE